MASQVLLSPSCSQSPLQRGLRSMVLPVLWSCIVHCSCCPHLWTFSSHDSSVLSSWQTNIVHATRGHNTRRRHATPQGLVAVAHERWSALAGHRERSSPSITIPYCWAFQAGQRMDGSCMLPSFWHVIGITEHYSHLVKHLPSVHRTQRVARCVLLSRMDGHCLCLT